MGSTSATPSLWRRLTRRPFGLLTIGLVVLVLAGLVWAATTTGMSVTEGIAQALIAGGVILLLFAIFNIGAPGADVMSGGEVAPFVPSEEEAPFAVGGPRRSEPVTRTWLWLLGGAVSYFVVAGVLLNL